MRIVCISDTHGQHGALEVPACDLLLHAGDISKRGAPHEIEDFCRWFAEQPARHKVFIAGNHDFGFERDAAATRDIVARYPVVYLQDSGVELEGLRIWGSPWQPWFFDWAFNLRKSTELAEKWALIAPDTQILLTHGPPRGLGDRTERGEAVGCKALLHHLPSLVDLKLHVYGHIHEGYGQYSHGAAMLINASSLDVRYRPVNAPVVIDLLV